MVIRFKQIASHKYLKRVAVVYIYEKEANGYGSKKPTNVRENLVDLLKASWDIFGNWRLVDKESSIERLRIGWVYCIPIFYTIFGDDATFIDPVLTKRDDTLVSLDRIIFHHDLTFLSISCRKDDIVAILKIVAQKLLRISIDQRIDEVYRVEKVRFIGENSIYLTIRSTWILKKWRVCASLYCNL